MSEWRTKAFFPLEKTPFSETISTPALCMGCYSIERFVLPSLFQKHTMLIIYEEKGRGGGGGRRFKTAHLVAPCLHPLSLEPSNPGHFHDVKPMIHDSTSFNFC